MRCCSFIDDELWNFLYVDECVFARACICVSVFIHSDLFLTSRDEKGDGGRVGWGGEGGGEWVFTVGC